MSTADLMEFVTTDSGVRLGKVTKEVRVALTRANLFLADEELRSVVKGLLEFTERFPEAVVGPIMKEPREFDAVLAGIGAITQFRNSLRCVEDLAVERLKSPVWHVPKG